MRRLDELIAALTLLTRLPVSGLVGSREWPDAASSVWAYPIVGALVGGVGGIVLWIAERSGLSSAIAAILALAAMLLLTGGLHEDGLADTADAFGGGSTAARKLEIMRDSRIGSYGALALIVALGLRGAALASLPPEVGMAALIAAGSLGRGAILVVLMSLSPARADSSAAPLRQVRFHVAGIGLLLAVAVSRLLSFHAALTCIFGAAVAGLSMAAFARRQVGGYTGDVLGAVAVFAECVALVIVAGVCS